MSPEPERKKTVAELLHDAEVLVARLDQAEIKARTAWELAGAKFRLAFKAKNESKKRRWSAHDIDATVLIEQSEPKSELGAAWIKFNKVRVELAAAQIEKRRLSRIHWEETKRW